MKEYSSGSFIDAAVRVYGSEADIITSFPASIIDNGGNITPWAIYGNTVEGVSVGERTMNLFDKNSDTTNNNGQVRPGVKVSSGTYSINNTTDRGVYYRIGNGGTTTQVNAGLKAENIVANDDLYVWRDNNVRQDGVMLNIGTTALPYEPYGFKLPVVIGSNTINIYMADVLRMSSGADPVYDIMSSTGTITRNVDTDGNPLITPTTESFTAPTLATVAGSQSVSFDTTVKPSRAELTYTGWHTHDDKKRSGGAWV